MENSTAKMPWIAYSVVPGKNGKKYWHRVGAAWVNRDGSWNVTLDSLPVDGKLHIREKREWDEKPPPGALQAETERIEA